MFLKFSLCLYEILSRFNSSVVLHLPDHFIISYDLKHLHLNIVYHVSLLHHIVCGLSCCIYKQLIKSMGIYLFPCSHRGECIITHNIVWNVFASIVRQVNVSFMFCENKHMFSCYLLYSFCIDGWVLCSPQIVSTF
jgi:hypothetical protein